MDNLDDKTVSGFGQEWNRFDQTEVPEQELEEMFSQYFKIFPWALVNKTSVGFDLGCGSGRWAKILADKVHKLHCIDPSKEALNVAIRNLSGKENCFFHLASVDAIPLEDRSMDFGYSLGVLHHVPNTLEGIKACVKKLKSGAPFLVYLYYAFDNRPLWFVLIWKGSNVMRHLISRLPFSIRYWITQLIAAIVYVPLAKTAFLFDKLGFSVEAFPLSNYRYRSFYSMRTDALDRFGTRLEHRFTSKEIRRMMEDAGLERIIFSENPPYWCALGYRR
jgi:SAM-dependent methyltransferase